jgi:hypothetical protein
VLTLLVATPAPVYKPNGFEAASPFLVTILLIILSAMVMPDIIARMEGAFKKALAKQKEAEEAKLAAASAQAEAEGKQPSPVEKQKKPPLDLAPETQAAASIWAIDTAQIPMMIGTPAASAFVLYKAIPEEFTIGYVAVLTLGVGFFLVFRRWMSIYWYASRGPRIFGLHFSLLTLTGIGLNAVGAIIAAIFIG